MFFLPPCPLVEPSGAKFSITQLHQTSANRQDGGLPLSQSITKVSLMKMELVTTLKRRATDIIAAVAKDRNPVLITQHGRPAAYLVDVETYEGLNEKLAVLEKIGRGERAVEQGRVVSHNNARKRMSRWLK